MKRLLLIFAFATSVFALRSQQTASNCQLVTNSDYYNKVWFNVCADVSFEYREDGNDFSTTCLLEKKMTQSEYDDSKGYTYNGKTYNSNSFNGQLKSYLFDLKAQDVQLIVTVTYPTLAAPGETSKYVTQDIVLAAGSVGGTFVIKRSGKL